MIDLKLLHELFEYRDGNLYRKIARTNSVRANEKVGTNCKDHLRVTINKKPYKLHRIVFFMHHGYFPKMVDHIDGNPFNNKIENLREATAQQNNRNQKLKPNNTSGCKNVTWNKTAKKWQVGLSINNKYMYIGTYKDLELADLVAHEARSKYFGSFLRHK
jgi:hypothetical protein